MVLTLYMNDMSPGVRAVFMTTAALNIEIENEIYLNILEKEEDKKELIKLNPACTLPSLEDDGYIVNESHTILMYLVEKFGKDDELYPKDIKKRSKVHYALMYDSSILFPALHRITIKIYELKTDGPSDDDREYAEYACDILEKILGEQTYVAGNFLSIADFSVIACISSLHYLIPIQMNTYPRITAWMKRMEHLPYYYMNQYGLEKQIKLMEECKNKHRRMNGEISSYSTSTCSEK